MKINFKIKVFLMIVAIFANMVSLPLFAQSLESADNADINAKTELAQEEIQEVSEQTFWEKIVNDSTENPFSDVLSEDSAEQTVEDFTEEFTEKYLAANGMNGLILKERDLLIADESVSPEVLLERYPKGSIVSREQAEEALSEVEKGKKRIDAIFQRDELECYDKFFTNMCIKDVKMARHASWNSIKPIKIEADIFIRQDKVRERDAKLGDRKEGDAVSPEERAKNQADYAKRQKDRAEAQKRVKEKHEKTAERRKRKAEDERKEEQERAKRLRQEKERKEKSFWNLFKLW